MGFTFTGIVLPQPVVDALEEVRRKKRIRMLLLAAAALIVFLVFRKKGKK